MLFAADIEKAFDSVEHYATLKNLVSVILKHDGLKYCLITPKCAS